MKKLILVPALTLALLVTPPASEQPVYAGDACTNRCLVVFTGCRIACDVRNDDCKEHCTHLDDASSQRRCRRECESDTSDCNDVCRATFKGCMWLCE